MNTHFKIMELDGQEASPSNEFSLDVLDCLSKTPKTLPAKYHYDAKGSQLFEQITELNEYYLTRCEQEILHRFKHEIAQIMASPSFFRLVELGVGDGHKTKELLNHFLEMGLSCEYVPIDCCQPVVSKLITSLRKEFSNSNLKVRGIVADYFDALSWLQGQEAAKTIVLFLGSSIGNFDRTEVQHFLHHIWSILKDGDYLFIGFDLKKEISTLEKAYNDSKGITREFNLNLLGRMNRELGANFDRNKFQFHSFYNPKEGRIESWLVSQEPQIVSFTELQKHFTFAAWEGIHVENSHKYSLKEIEELAKSNDFVVEREFLDSKGYFTGAVWRIKKQPMAKVEEVQWTETAKYC